MPDPSPRDRLIWLKPWDWSMDDIAQVIDAYRNQIRAADAATVRAAKVREPVDDAEEYLNAVLEDVAVKIEGTS